MRHMSDLDMSAWISMRIGGGVIFAEQILADEWKKMIMINARDAGQFAKGRVLGAINMN